MPSKPDPGAVRVILFDVGGVLVEVAGLDVMRGWLDPSLTAAQLWRRWLLSPVVRAFETGQLEPMQFAIGVTREFELPVAPQQFLQSFETWCVGLYPGVVELLAKIPASYDLALLSNSNAVHWPRLRDEMGLARYIPAHFVSHLTGRIKPDPDAFEQVLATLGCQPAEILFLDDNQLNVDAAAHLGIQATRVQGPAEAQRALVARGILQSG